MDDVGQGYDLLQNTPQKIVATLGRHPNDLMTSHYMRTPSEIYVECGWGGREIDDTTPPVEMTTVGSFWGHKGLFEAIGGPPSAVPDIGTRRAPVQVIEGNYQCMAGVCPWCGSGHIDHCFIEIASKTPCFAFRSSSSRTNNVAITWRHEKAPGNAGAFEFIRED